MAEHMQEFLDRAMVEAFLARFEAKSRERMDGAPLPALMVWSIAAETTRELLEGVRDLPSAEVAPVLHGQWLQLIDWDEAASASAPRMGYSYGVMYRCDTCGSETVGPSSFCPNCGATMAVVARSG